MTGEKEKESKCKPLLGSHWHQCVIKEKKKKKDLNLNIKILIQTLLIPANRSIRTHAYDAALSMLKRL